MRTEDHRRWQLYPCKICSDDFSKVLALQGVNLLVRIAATTAFIHLIMCKPSPNEIEMVHFVTAGKISGSTLMTGSSAVTRDSFFGTVEGKSRWVSVEEERKSGIVGQREGDWIEWESDGKLIQAEGKNPDGEWEAAHLWDIEIVDGERRHTRMALDKNSQCGTLKVRMIFDYVSETSERGC